MKCKYWVYQSQLLLLPAGFMSFGQSVYIHIMRLFSENISWYFADVSCGSYLGGSFNAAIFAVGNSLIRKSSSHILHIFTVTLPFEQQCFSSCSRWVLASVWCCWPFLPLVVPLAHQIVLSALDKTALILLLLPRPVQALDMLTSSPSFALFIPADRQLKGRPAGMWG